jgi:hypothetical protein
VGDTIVAATAPTVLSIARAVASSAMSLESVEIEGQKSINYLCSLPNVKRLSTSFQSAAGSNLAYFESLIVAEVAKAFNMPPDQAKIRFAGVEPDYLVALMAGTVPDVDAHLEVVLARGAERPDLGAPDVGAAREGVLQHARVRRAARPRERARRAGRHRRDPGAGAPPLPAGQGAARRARTRIPRRSTR